MITDYEYRQAVKDHSASQEIINQYHRQEHEKFQQRLKDNPIFTDDELFYSAYSRCPCGHGLAYPKSCGANHYWDCSAILKGIADKGVTHTDQLPFAFWDIKGESEHRGTTRGTVVPKETG